MNTFGKIAEMQAWKYLENKKYKLIDFNYQTRFGEIDIIAENKKYIVFVEVKMRSSNYMAEPMEYVDYNKQKRIIATAQMYLSQNKTKKQPRFDVIEIISDNYEIKSIKHLENAFTLV
jgi:putative endonuclease